MSLLAPIPFDPVMIPVAPSPCQLRMASLTESTGRLQGFSPTKTFYLFFVPGATATLTVTAATTGPVAASSVTVNGAPMATPVTLSDNWINQVWLFFYFILCIFFCQTFVHVFSVVEQVKIVLSATGFEPLVVTLWVRRMKSTAGCAGAYMSCFLNTGKVVCWGV
jgi:hypothetical protein